MNPARLAELERQRALVRLHLDWLEKEIANEASTMPVSAPASPGVPLTPSTVTDPKAAPPSLSAPDAPPSDIDSYQPDPVSAAVSARRGCLLYLCVAVLLALVALTTLYLTLYRGHPLFRISGEAPSAGKISSPPSPTVHPPK